MKEIILKWGLKFKGRDSFKDYNNFKKREYDSVESNLNYQRGLLNKLLLHAAKNAPYYRRVLKAAGVVKDGLVSLAQFNKIPILTKNIIRKHFNDIKSVDYKKRSPYFNTSGGSTGEPVKFIQDNKYWASVTAGTWLGYSFLGNFPCRHLKLWGSEKETLQSGIGLKNQIQNWIYNRRILNSFRMSEADMFNFVKIINSYKPKFIEAYVQSIFELSKFIEKNRLRIYKPNGIISAAGTLYPDFKEQIKKVFGCPVLNRYGSREVGSVAHSCKKEKGLHLDIFNNYLEILNDKLEPCKPDELGSIFITNLQNYSMPLIRFKIGDVGIPAKKITCSCGRGLPLIQAVKGRDVNIFKTQNGELIDGEYFTHLFYMKSWIKKFQVVQKDYNLIKISIVGGTNKEMKNIEEAIKFVMGKRCIVQWNFVDDIKPLKSGKYLYTISEVK